jgi:glycosyltransferase involved in cell wall biosynthesis
MKISYLVTTHNEGIYINDLLTCIELPAQLTGDEIVIVDDNSTDQMSLDILQEAEKRNIKVRKHSLNRDFAKHKNWANSNCTGDYIFQLDADEIPPAQLIHHLHDIIKDNNDVDVILIPRINIVYGLTPQDVARWGWQVNEKGWIMFPDFQARIYKNTPNIKWYGNVHEQIIGNRTLATLPAEEMWAIKHYKDIERQRKQNSYYEEIIMTVPKVSG